MNINKKLAIGAAALFITGAAATATALAAASPSTGSSSYPPIVQKIADRFHLNPADINQVFQQQKQLNQDQRTQKISDYLEQKVNDGVITEDQKTKILVKLEELHQQLKNQSKDQRRQTAEDLRSQLEKWAKDNGINNLDQLLPPYNHKTMMHKMNN